MAAYFFDTSALLKRYVNERGTAVVVALTDPAAGHVFYVSGLTLVEAVAAVARRMKGQSLSPSIGAQTLTRIRNDFGSLFTQVPVSPALLSDAERLAQRHALRAYDSVQLVTALSVAAALATANLPSPTFVCSDLELNAAASAEGLTIADPTATP